MTTEGFREDGYNCSTALDSQPRSKDSSRRTRSQDCREAARRRNVIDWPLRFLTALDLLLFLNLFFGFDVATKHRSILPEERLLHFRARKDTRELNLVVTIGEI